MKRSVLVITGTSRQLRATARALKAVAEVVADPPEKVPGGTRLIVCDLAGGAAVRRWLRDLGPKGPALLLLGATPARLRTLRQKGPHIVAAVPESRIPSSLLEALVRLAAPAPQARTRQPDRPRPPTDTHFDLLPILVCRVDPSGTIVDANRRFLETVGLPRTEVVGMPFDSLVEGPDTARDTLMGAWQSKRGARADIRLHRANGTAIEAGLETADADGSNFVVLQDVSRRKRAEAQLARYAQDLEAANRRLTETQRQLVQTEKMASIGLLVAGIAHEVDNPLRFLEGSLRGVDTHFEALTGLLDEYAQAPMPESARLDLARRREELGVDNAVAEIHRVLLDALAGAGRIREIVGGLTARPEQEDSTFGPVNMNEAVRWAVTLVGARKPPDVQIELDLGEIDRTLGRMTQLGQVYTNLLLNAIQAMGDSGTVTVKTRSVDGRVIATVRDSGPGIPEEVIDHIFEPFFTTKSGEETGTGLGLYMSYRIIEGHGGTIEATNHPGGGALFTITLPVCS